MSRIKQDDPSSELPAILTQLENAEDGAVNLHEIDHFDRNQTGVLRPSIHAEPTSQAQGRKVEDRQSVNSDSLTATQIRVADERRQQARERLRKKFVKVAQMQSAQAKWKSPTPRGDVRHFGLSAMADAIGKVKAKCNISMIDYGATKVAVTSLNNQDLINLLHASSNNDRPIWRKVRWIDIGGISSDVLYALITAYNTHPLAVEEILNRRFGDRAWAENYHQHLFIRLLNHVLHEDQRSGDRAIAVSEDEDDSSDEQSNHGDDHDDDHMTPNEKRPLGMRSNSGVSDVENGSGLKPLPPAPQTDRKATLAWLKGHERVKVRIQDIFLFLFRDGTLISIRAERRSVFAPIMDRLKIRDSLLRTNPHNSILLHAILDHIADEALLVVDRYDSQLAKFEEDVLIQARMKTVRSVRVIASDLRLLKRTIGSMMTVVTDLTLNTGHPVLTQTAQDTTLELLKPRLEGGRAGSPSSMGRAKSPADSAIQPAKPKIDPTNGDFISPKGRMYMGSIKNNLDFIISSFEMFEGSAQDLIEYAIQIIDHEATSMMRCLTIIFFPLTFLTAYFGMNFNMHQVDVNTDLYFWKIAGPLMVAIIAIFGAPEVTRLVQYIQRKAALRRMSTRETNRRERKIRIRIIERLRGRNPDSK